MKKSRRKQDFVRTPKYPGGVQALKEFVAKNKRYPKEALENKIEGAVYVKYSVSQNGKVVDAKVIEGIGYGCDEEALRVVKLLRFEKVKNRGVNITSHFKITIKFRLKDVKTKQISYTVKKTSEKPSNTTYSYSIKLPNPD